MEYKKRERKRRSGDELLARDRASAGKSRGARFTFFSFVAVVVSLAVVKAVNPDVPMRSPVIMLTSVALACVMVILIGRRNG